MVVVTPPDDLGDLVSRLGEHDSQRRKVLDRVGVCVVGALDGGPGEDAGLADDPGQGNKSRFRRGPHCPECILPACS